MPENFNAGQEPEIEQNNSETQETQETQESETESRESKAPEKELSERAKQRSVRRETDKSATKDYRQMYDNMMKERANERSLYDRQMNEIRQQQAEFSKHQKLLQEIADLKSKSELEVLKKSNPDAYQQKLIENAISEKLKSQQLQNTNQTNTNQSEVVPTQEQFIQLGNQATDYLRAHPEIGENDYRIMEPHMVSLLKSVEPRDAAKLLQNPEALYNMALGQLYRQETKNRNNTQRTGTAKANEYHEGTARPVSTSTKTKDFSKMSDKELNEAKNAELLREYGIRN